MSDSELQYSGVAERSKAERRVGLIKRAEGTQYKKTYAHNLEVGNF